MGDTVIIIITSLLGLGIGGLAGFLWCQHLVKRQRGRELDQVSRQVEQAKADALRIKSSADASIERERALLASQREQAETEIKGERQELKETEKRLVKREDNLDAKTAQLAEREAGLRATEERLEGRNRDLDVRAGEIDALVAKQRVILHEVAELPPEAAREIVLQKTEEELSREIETRIELAEARAKETADEKAQRHVAAAIQRLALDYTAEHVVSTLELPAEELKGRIIGREGRNIRAFENATGIDVIVDDTPGVVVLSGFEPVRREIAVRSLRKLVADGRIHPSRIEEVVAKTRDEMDKILEETGKGVALELDVRNLKPREIMLLGRLKFRTSYGQNVLDHSREVGFLAGSLAAELGLDQALARRCGLLHDIGKAVDHEEEGTHPELGAEVARRSSETLEVVNAIAAHHSDTAAESLYASLVQIADGMSAARPGARRDTLEKYVKRLDKLESIATANPQVEKAFAIQAGRELRVIVRADKVDDDAAARLCREIAQRIEKELTYPGEVKVTLVREFRVTEYAR